jgi:hypothetical protein
MSTHGPDWRMTPRFRNFSMHSISLFEPLGAVTGRFSSLSFLLALFAALRRFPPQCRTRHSANSLVSVIGPKRVRRKSASAQPSRCCSRDCYATPEGKVPKPLRETKKRAHASSPLTKVSGDSGGMRVRRLTFLEQNLTARTLELLHRQRLHPGPIGPQTKSFNSQAQ